MTLAQKIGLAPAPECATTLALGSCPTLALGPCPTFELVLAKVGGFALARVLSALCGVFLSSG
jgi:hypothetical protein